MSSSTKKAGGVIHYFRYGINFIERFLKNTGIQIKWLWKQGKLTHKKFTEFHTIQFGNPPHIIVSAITGIVIIIIGYFLFWVLLIWAGLKSI